MGPRRCAWRGGRGKGQAQVSKRDRHSVFWRWVCTSNRNLGTDKKKQKKTGLPEGERALNRKLMGNSPPSTMWHCIFQPVKATLTETPWLQTAKIAAHSWNRTELQGILKKGQERRKHTHIHAPTHTPARSDSHIHEKVADLASRW